MTAVWLLLPIFLIRMVFLRIIDKNSYKKANYLPQLLGVEKLFFIIYQITNFIIWFYLLIIPINFNNITTIIGLIIYSIGLFFYYKSNNDFTNFDKKGVAKKGLYNYSRHPIYLSYFIMFFGIGIISQSIIYFIILLVFQISVHFLIKSEERYCKNKYGENYLNYMKKTRMYF